MVIKVIVVNFMVKTRLGAAVEMCDEVRLWS